MVGVQPFGGEGKSGTGPKAGGPLYLKRLQRNAVATTTHQRQPTPALDALTAWANLHGQQRLAALIEQYSRTSLLGTLSTLPGPTGERNTLALLPRGSVLCAASTQPALLNQLAAVLATGNTALVMPEAASLLPTDLPAAVKDRIVRAGDSVDGPFQVALVESQLAASLHTRLAAREGALASLIDTTAEDGIPLWRLLAERALCVNTTAAGGNASLMTLSV